MVGSIYALIAVAFSIVYNTTEAINFSQGEFTMLGGMMAAVIFKHTRMPLWAVVPLAIAATTMVGPQ